MADGKKFINLQTGEIIVAKNRFVAYKVFKADGKFFNYKVGYKDVKKWADGKYHLTIVKQ